MTVCVCVRYTVPSVVSSLKEARLNRHTHQFNQYISMRSLNYFHWSLTSVFMSFFSLSFIFKFFLWLCFRLMSWCHITAFKVSAAAQLWHYGGSEYFVTGWRTGDDWVYSWNVVGVNSPAALFCDIYKMVLCPAGPIPSLHSVIG